MQSEDQGFEVCDAMRLAEMEPTTEHRRFQPNMLYRIINRNFEIDMHCSGMIIRSLIAVGRNSLKYRAMSRDAIELPNFSLGTHLKHVSTYLGRN